MAQTVEAVARGELRRVGLPAQGRLARLLIALRGAAETHLTQGEIARLAEAQALGLSSPELASQLEALVRHGLLARLPSTGAEPVFDTVPAPHSHLMYEETAQVVDLDVSAETLIAILRQALAERPGEVDILVRFRRPGG
jgi:Fur family iron response transcriptional regulator